MGRLRKAFDSEMSQGGRELLILAEEQRQQTGGGAPVSPLDPEDEAQSSEMREPETSESASQGGLSPDIDEPAAVEMPAAPVVDGQVDNHTQREMLPPTRITANPSGISPSVIGSDLESTYSPGAAAAAVKPVPLHKQAMEVSSSS